MFEKDAEEIANKRCHEIMCFGHCSFSSPKHHRCGEWHREYNCAKEGIEYGYNKANEWHYPSKGEYPEENKIVLIYAKNEEGYGHDFMTYHKDNGWYGYGSYCKEVIAWKELDTPKESK